MLLCLMRSVSLLHAQSRSGRHTLHLLQQKACRFIQDDQVDERESKEARNAVHATLCAPL
jgi:hypothetical protein